ncbi:MAG: PIN domain-containing protein [Pseudomonadota bacterium]
MTARAFADTNIDVYAESDDGAKTARAMEIIEAGPVIGVQVVNETISVLTRKHGFSRDEAYEVAGGLMDLCEVIGMDGETVRGAMQLSDRYALSHWDSLIVAAALQSGCDTLNSEDFQNGQLFDGRLKVVNPFI